MEREPSYSGLRAVHNAAALGLTVTHAGWRRIFLAITDAISGEITQENIKAIFVGNTRFGERWKIVMDGREVDAIYHPQTVTIGTLIAVPVHD